VRRQANIAKAEIVHLRQFIVLALNLHVATNASGKEASVRYSAQRGLFEPVAQLDWQRFFIGHAFAYEGHPT